MSNNSVTCRILEIDEAKDNDKTYLCVDTSFLCSLLCFCLKDFHYHNTSYHGSDKASVSHNASLKQVCSTCDFTMHESVEAKATVFQPVVAISWVPKRIFTEQTVYQVIVSVNSHSPPTVG